MYECVYRHIYTYMNKKIATTVKVDETTYDQFKVLGIRYKITFQGLIERSVYRYVNEDAYRDEINNFIIPVLSESVDSGSFLT